MKSAKLLERESNDQSKEFHISFTPYIDFRMKNSVENTISISCLKMFWKTLKSLVSLI